MTPLVQFMLQQIGLPVVTMIIKDFQTKNNNSWPSSEQVVQTFMDDISKWTAQGNAWLLANPKQ